MRNSLEFSPVLLYYRVCPVAGKSRPVSQKMIAFLKGTLVESLPTSAVIDVHGVGYEVLMPLSSTSKLPEIGREVKIYTHFAVREDAQTLYGFITLEERHIFRTLINSVSGIGPKIALNVLSGMSIEAFRAAVSSGDFKSLSHVNGIGKKTAERIIVELKDKMGPGLPSGSGGSGGAVSFTAGTMDQTLNDALAALVTLGFKQTDALTSVKAAQAMLGPGATVEQIIRACLKK